MSSFRIGNALLTVAAALTGSIVGNGLRLFIQAKSEHAQRAASGDETASEIELTITGVISNTVAATALALVVDRAAPLVGFLAGAGLSAATGDAPDRMIMDLLRNEPEGFVPMELEEVPDGV